MGDRVDGQREVSHSVNGWDGMEVSMGKKKVKEKKKGEEGVAG